MTPESWETQPSVTASAMRLRSALKIASIAALSLMLNACAGKAPVMERPVELFRGRPSAQAMCRITKAQMTALARFVVKHKLSKKYAARVVEAALKADAEECVAANSPEFGGMLGITSDDFRVMLQYQEALLYSCAKWKD